MLADSIAVMTEKRAVRKNAVKVGWSLSVGGDAGSNGDSDECSDGGTDRSCGVSEYRKQKIKN